jgi:hypothetical protein
MHDNRQNIESLTELLNKKIGEMESKCLIDTIFYLFEKGNKVGSIEIYPVKPDKDFLNSNRLLLCDGKAIPEKAKGLISFLNSERTPNYTGMFLRGNTGKRKFSEPEEDTVKEHTHEITGQEAEKIGIEIVIPKQDFHSEIKINPVRPEGKVRMPDLRFEVEKANISKIEFTGQTKEAGAHTHTAYIELERNHSTNYKETNLKSEMIPDGFGERRAYTMQEADKVNKLHEYKDEFKFSVDTSDTGEHTHEIYLQAIDTKLDLVVREIKGNELSLSLDEISFTPSISIEPIEEKKIEFDIEIPAHSHECKEFGESETRPKNMPVYYYIHY